MVADPKQRDKDTIGDNDVNRYWRWNKRVILSLLAVWAAVSYGCSILFIEPLNRISIGKVPLGFWFSQQGSIFVFVALIFIYAWIMDWLDRRFDVEE